MKVSIIGKGVGHRACIHITKKARVHLPLAEFVASALLASSNGVLQEKFREFVKRV